MRVPEAASPRLKAYLDVVVPRSVQRADHILADSQATKDDLIALYGTPPEKITVLLSGVDARFHPTSMTQPCAQKYKIPRATLHFLGRDGAAAQKLRPADSGACAAASRGL